MATHICCKDQMRVVKATTGCFKQSDFDHKGNPVKKIEDPVLVYECQHCGKMQCQHILELFSDDSIFKPEHFIWDKTVRSYE